jgi:hypothetical protein
MTAPLVPHDSGEMIRLAAQVARLADEQAQLIAELRRMQERIYGNGKPGLINELADMRHDVRGIIIIAYALMGVAVPLVASLLWQIFTGQLKITP